MRTFAGLLIAFLPAFGQRATPFTVVEVSRRGQAPGQSLKESRFLFAMRSDGWFVFVDLDPSSGGTRQIIDPVGHRSILLNPESRVAIITPYDGRPQLGVQDSCDQRFR